jgi:hypothetical protein
MSRRIDAIGKLDASILNPRCGNMDFAVYTAALAGFAAPDELSESINRFASACARRKRR